MEISSIRNPLLQKIRKAVASGRPTDDGYLVAEGPHLVEEALRSPWRIAQLFTTPVGKIKYADLIEAVKSETIEVAARTFDAIGDTQHSQQILALVEPKTWSWEDLTAENALVLVLDGIQDPGNAGTMVRSAEAFGATGLVFLTGSAHVSNGKLLRAAAGSMFRMPSLEGVTAGDLLSHTHRFQMYALDSAGAVSLPEARLDEPCILIAGNEGRGVRPELLPRATRISIPTGKVESLNAAVACSLALYTAWQQRTTS